VRFFLWAKGLNAKDIHNDMFPVYAGKFLSHKTVHSWVKKFSQECSKVAYDARPGAEVAETTVKILLCCGFQRTGKVIGQVYQCWWRICREINVLPMFEYNMFYVLHPFVTYLLTPPHKIVLNLIWESMFNVFTPILISCYSNKMQ
jgi:hypothetical protein